MNKVQVLDWSFLDDRDKEKVETFRSFKLKIKFVREIARKKKVIGHNLKDIEINGIAPVVAYVCTGCDRYVSGMPYTDEHGWHHCRICGESLGDVRW